MTKLHITQDDHDYWMLSVEQEDGTIGVLAHQFSTPDKLLEIAQEMMREKRVQATIVVAPPRVATASRGDASRRGPGTYEKPAPRKADE